MRRRTSAFVTGAFLVLCSAGAAFAQDANSLTSAQLAESRDKVQIASGLIVMARAEKDPVMMMAALNILSDLGSSVIDPKSIEGGGKPAAYDLAALTEEAKSLAGGNDALLTQIKAMPKPMAAPAVGTERYCGWGYECGYFSCGYVYSCGW